MSETDLESNCEDSDEELDVRQQTESSDNYSKTESISGKKLFICEYKGCDKRYKDRNFI